MATTTTVPTYTAAAAGNVIASASIAASGTSSSTTGLDFSAVFEGQLHILNTPGGSVAATRGLQCQIFRRYGTTPTTGQTALLTYTLPSATASTAESLDIFLPTGKYAITLTNLDATNAIVASVTSDTIANVTTS
jgi:hypothetical protein